MNIGGENEFVEHKKTTSEIKEGMVSISSILNKHGYGELFFGVRNDGEAFGTGIPRIRDACKEAGVEFEYVRTAFGTKFVFHRKDAFADNAADNLPEVAEWPPAGWGALGVTDRAVLLHLYRHGESRTSVISNNTGIPERTVRSSLGRLAGKGLVFPHGSNRNRSYRLS